MLDAIKDAVDWLVTQFWDIVQTLLLAILNAIPVPDWAQNAGDAVQFLVEHAGYGLWITACDVGVPIIFSAMTIRFIIRRIPGIG